jgi:hypothetical protein
LDLHRSIAGRNCVQDSHTTVSVPKKYSAALGAVEIHQSAHIPDRTAGKERRLLSVRGRPGLETAREDSESKDSIAD